ncbi:MAG: hypothetical protein QM764_14015 [Chitinophagaceae bacterium]
MDDITIEELEILFKLIIQKLQRDKCSKIDFKGNEYWIVSSDEWMNFIDTPTPVVGSLKEDVVYLKKAIGENAIHSYSEFDRLATVLRFISESQAPISP